MEFREILKEKKLTQDDVAKIVGKSQRLISNWVTNRSRPTYDDLPKLANYLKMNVEDLVACFQKRRTETSPEEYTPSGGKSNGQEST